MALKKGNIIIFKKMFQMIYESLFKKNMFKSFLEDFGFQQLIKKATHDEGHGLDHIYVSNENIIPKEHVYLKPLYFSDHDAMCIGLDKNSHFM